MGDFVSSVSDNWCFFIVWYAGEDGRWKDSRQGLGEARERHFVSFCLLALRGYGYAPYGYGYGGYGYDYAATAPLYDYAAPAYGYGAVAPATAGTTIVIVTPAPAYTAPSVGCGYYNYAPGYWGGYGRWGAGYWGR
jgi:hypothetical protein